MQEKMYEVMARDFGGPEALEYVEVTRPEPGPGEVLIRVEAASVNFADVMRRRASPYPFPTALPYVPGSEVAGRIERLGEGVDTLVQGQAVCASVGEFGESGYAQFAVARVQQVVALPDDLPMEVACGVSVAGVTAMLLLEHTVAMKPGETVFIQGAAGGVGTLCIQIARKLGAGMIIAAASTPSKRAYALELGADHAIDYTQPGWESSLRELTGGRGVDVVLEMSGADSLERCMSALAPFGRIAVFGAASQAPRTLSQPALDAWLATPALGQTISAFNVGLYFGMKPEQAARAAQRVFEWILSGEIEARVGHLLPLEQAARAHRLLESRASTGKIVLAPWRDSGDWPEAIYHNEFAAFTLTDGVLGLRWSPTTARMDERDLRDTLLAYATSALVHRPRGLLIDLRGLRAEGQRPDAWRDTHLVPRYDRAGVERLAYLWDGVSERVGDELEHEGLPTRWFTEEEAASSWLSQE